MTPLVTLRWADGHVQERRVVYVHDAFYALDTRADEVQWWQGHTPQRQRAFARLQARFFPNLSATRPTALPVSHVANIRAEAHPFALYAAAEDLIGATVAMSRPDAITLAELVAQLPYVAGLQWIQYCDDCDFVAFAMDAAGYRATAERIGRSRAAERQARHVFVRRDIADAWPAIRALKKKGSPP